MKGSASNQYNFKTFNLRKFGYLLNIPEVPRSYQKKLKTSLRDSIPPGVAASIGNKLQINLTQ